MSEENEKLSEETLDNLYKLGEVLRRIHNRLLAEGVISIGPDGKVIFPEKKPEVIKRRKSILKK